MKNLPLSVLSAALATLLLVSLAACGNGDTAGVGTVTVSGLPENQALLCASGTNGQSGLVQIAGSGFLSEHGTDITVTWTATDGSTPFEGGTEATEITAGTVLSDTLVEVELPGAVGLLSVTITITLRGGNEGTSEPMEISIGGTLIGPFGVGDDYQAIGNVPLNVAPDQGVLINDIPVFCGDEDVMAEKPGAGGAARSHTPFVVTGVDPVSNQGGDIVMDADGGFTYDPPAGFQGFDFFFYQFEQGGRSGSGFVGVQVSDMVWFIDDKVTTSGSGKMTSPFKDLGDFRAVQGGGTMLPDVGHTIFIYNQGPNDPYDGGITLLDDQRLFGEGFGLNMQMQQIVAPGTRPELNNTQQALGDRAGDTVITLASRNEIRGLDIVAPNAFGIQGFGVSGPTMIDDISIRDSSIYGIDLDFVTGNFQVGDPVNPAAPTFRISGMQEIGINISGGSGQTGPSTFLTGTTALNVFGGDIANNSFSSPGIRVSDADLDLNLVMIDDCHVGVEQRVPSGGTCAYNCVNTNIGVTDIIRFRGVVLEPLFGTINATHTTTDTYGHETAFFADAGSGQIQLELDSCNFGNVVTGALPAIDLRGNSLDASALRVSRSLDVRVIGNNTGGGYWASFVEFDADPLAVGLQPLSCGTSTLGQSVAGRIDETALRLTNSTGTLNFDALTIFQNNGDPSGIVLSGGVVVNATTLSVDRTP